MQLFINKTLSNLLQLNRGRAERDNVENVNNVLRDKLQSCFILAAWPRSIVDSA
jgi:hypothetical protein